MSHSSFRAAGMLSAAVTLGSAAIGSAQAYEWQINDQTVFGVGGDIELAYQIKDNGPGHERDLFDNGSEIDFFGEHALMNGWFAFFMAQFEYTVDEASDPSFESDDVYFGVRSEKYGSVRIGDWNGIYDDRIDDRLDEFEVGEVGGSTEDYRTESGDSIAYYSPVFGGLSFAVQGFFKGEDHDPSTTDGQAFQATVQYQADPIGLYVGYDDNGTDDGADATLGLGASIDLEPITLAAKFETFGGDSSPDKLCENTSGSDVYCPYEKQGMQMYGVRAAYDYGPGIVQLAVNHIDPESSALDSRTAYGAYVNYEITDNFYIYAEHMGQDKSHGAGDYTATGLVYEF